MEFRDALRSLRCVLGVTQVELANALHVDSATISRWELGKSTPNRSASTALLEYARVRSAPADCFDNLSQAIAGVSKKRLEASREPLTEVEHASLRQIIDDASFPLYVCDMKTDELLYINRRMEEMLGGSLEQLPSRKCYSCLMRRDAPCEFCHKDQLRTDQFTAFDAFRPDDRTLFRVQGKQIMWNGRRAQVRYVFDMAGSVDVSFLKDRAASYHERIRQRKENTDDAVATAHFNLTHNVVSNVFSNNQALVDILKSESIDGIIAALLKSPFSDEDKSKLESIDSRAAMIQQFYAGKTHISIKHYSEWLGGYFECTFDLLQNPITFDIEAFTTLWDITEATMAADIADRLFSIDYESITAIDAETGQAHPYMGRHINDVISEQKAVGDNVAGVEAYLRKHCVDDDVERVIRGTSLPYVKAQLETKPYYHIAYTLKQDDRLVYKRTMYTYLDERKAIILCAMQDLTDIHALENKKRNQATSPFTDTKNEHRRNNHE